MTLEMFKCWKLYLTDYTGLVLIVAVRGVGALQLPDVMPLPRLVLDADLPQWYLPRDPREVREHISITCSEHVKMPFCRRLDFEKEGMLEARPELQLRLYCSVLQTIFEFPGLSLTAVSISPYLVVINHPMTSSPAASGRSEFSRENNGPVGCLNLNLNVIINESTFQLGYSGILETYVMIRLHLTEPER